MVDERKQLALTALKAQYDQFGNCKSRQERMEHRILFQGMLEMAKSAELITVEQYNKACFTADKVYNFEEHCQVRAKEILEDIFGRAIPCLPL